MTVVLEEWMEFTAKHRLVVTPRGKIECEWFWPTANEWFVCRQTDHLPVFAPTKTPRRPVAKSSRRTRSLRG